MSTSWQKPIASSLSICYRSNWHQRRAKFHLPLLDGDVSTPAREAAMKGKPVDPRVQSSVDIRGPRSSDLAAPIGAQSGPCPRGRASNSSTERGRRGTTSIASSRAEDVARYVAKALGARTKQGLRAYVDDDPTLQHLARLIRRSRGRSHDRRAA
jgi:hypothetical protein